MIPLSAEEAGVALGVGPLFAGVPAVEIDSRRIRKGQLFVALRGERFDGHDFVVEAMMAGAGGAVVERAWWEKNGRTLVVGGGVPEARIYPVPDTRRALSALAKAVRGKSQAVVIAVTGSVGKTGTKDLLGLMASRVGKVVTTSANENNEIGVPLTLLSIEEDTAVAVVEMGMRGKGQIAALTAMAEPDVGVITNVQPVHLELLGTLADVAEAKAELLAGLGASGRGVIPAECPLLDSYIGSLQDRIVRFGLQADRECADVWAEHVRLPGGREAAVSLHWPGGTRLLRTPFASDARLHNATAAAAACWAAGLELGACLGALEEAEFTPGRGDVEDLGPWLIIDDTYNASPAAVRASLDELVRLAGEIGRRPVAVLGDMLELGSEAVSYHREVGRYAAEVGVRALWAVGPLSLETAESFGASAPERPTGHVGSAYDTEPVVESLLPGDLVLFKASRSLKLEIMVEAVRAVAAGQGSGRDADREGLKGKRHSCGRVET